MGTWRWIVSLSVFSGIFMPAVGIAENKINAFLDPLEGIYATLEPGALRADILARLEKKGIPRQALHLVQAFVLAEWRVEEDVLGEGQSLISHLHIKFVDDRVVCAYYNIHYGNLYSSRTRQKGIC